MSTEQKRLFGNVRHKFKVFNDPIHGHIEMHPLCVSIIDTPQFQRLRYIKQLGGCYFVFPGASHNRFEHSLGVAHLAFKFLESLHSRQDLSKWNIEDKDILCVMIAGLCHDLGHGPFSHLFDRSFIPAARAADKDKQEQKATRAEPWEHEDASVEMLDHLITTNELKAKFFCEEYGKLDERDITFIKDLIRGPKEASHQAGEWPYKSRDCNKSFLYELIANKESGIDVDKWDYFARDCHHLGISNQFDHNRVMKFARVINVDGKPTICFRDKQILDLHEMFHVRAMLHRRAYQHKVNNGVEIMITDALIEANKAGLGYKDKNGKKWKMSDTIDNMESYTKLTDAVYHKILNSDKEELATARNILERIEKRQIYECVGEAQPKENEEINTKKEGVKSAIENEIWRKAGTEKLQLNDLYVQILNFNYGKGKRNPLEEVKFYKKYGEIDAVDDGTDPDVQAIPYDRVQVSQMLPSKFQEQYIRLYCRNDDQEVKNVAREAFKQWCLDRKDIQDPKDWAKAGPSPKRSKTEVSGMQAGGSRKKTRKK